jgi:ribosomal protein S27AE
MDFSEQDIIEHQDASPCYLTLVRPRCPSCGCPRFRAYKTVRNGTPGSDDDSLTRYSRCVDCGQRVVMVIE